MAMQARHLEQNSLFLFSLAQVPGGFVCWLEARCPYISHAAGISSLEDGKGIFFGGGSKEKS